jgi:hypothetical protein
VRLVELRPGLIAVALVIAAGCLPSPPVRPSGPVGEGGAPGTSGAAGDDGQGAGGDDVSSGAGTGGEPSPGSGSGGESGGVAGSFGSTGAGAEGGKAATGGAAGSHVDAGASGTAGGTGAAGSDADAMAAMYGSYATYLGPLLMLRCGGCHYGTQIQGSFQISYAGITAHVSNANSGCSALDASKLRAVPGKPLNSLVYIKTNGTSPPGGCGGHMPFSGSSLAQEEQDGLGYWIQQGAKP